MVIKNPIIDGRYADPEARKYGNKYYIYLTGSKRPLNIDAYSSYDLVNWEKHEGIIAIEEFPHVHKCVWAPTVIDKDGKYYLIFASNDIHNDDEAGGLEIAVSDKPEGPFHSFIDKPLVDRFHNGAQPIDAHLFQDDDGTIYLYYGGWGHCNVCRMNKTMTGIDKLADNGNTYFREITPSGYTEAPCILKRDGVYYFMWSGGSWTDGTYSVSYATSSSPIGGFSNATPILSTQLPLAEGPGHHGYIYLEEKDEYLIAYHRRIPGDNYLNRFICLDRMIIKGGKIEPIIMTDKFEL